MTKPRGPLAGAVATLLSVLCVLVYAAPLMIAAGVLSPEPEAAGSDRAPEAAEGGFRLIPALGARWAPGQYLVSIGGDLRCGEAQMGVREAVNDGRYGVEGPPDNPDPHLASTRPEKTAGHGAAPDTDAPSAPFGRERALGTDALSRRGKMWGDQIALATGDEGLGLARADSGSTKQLRWEATGDTARVIHTGLGVRGPLRPSAVGRVMSGRFAELRDCFAGSRTAGRWEIRFDVDARGVPHSVRIDGSERQQPKLRRCLQAKLAGISFPSSERGGSAVVYPLMVSVARARGSTRQRRAPCCGQSVAKQ